MFHIQERTLPPKSLLITFDDAYRNHYDIALPELNKRNVSGLFFIPGKVVKERKILDVNKIHLILSKLDIKTILNEIYLLIKQNRVQYNFEGDENIYNKFVDTGKKAGYRWDTNDIIFIKQGLQRLLPKPIRKKIIDNLFTKIYGNDEEKVSSEIYMNSNEVNEMINNQMYIGAHGFEHDWLNSMNKDEQQEELLKSCQMLKGFKINEKLWSISFPFGGFDKTTLDLCKIHEFKLGFTTLPKTADLINDDVLTMPRLDTNDFPCKDNSNPPIHYYYS